MEPVSPSAAAAPDPPQPAPDEPQALLQPEDEAIPGGPPWLSTAAIAAAVFITFDGVATWFEVVKLKIATEGNPILRDLADSVGFGPAMAIRVVLGLLLLMFLWKVAGKGSTARARRIGLVGVSVACSFFALLSAYHIWGILTQAAA